MSKVGGALLLTMDCVTWADKGLLLLLTPALPNVEELFTAEYENKDNITTGVI